nr:immunoglobulin heavy chain junction region [Macaca mulatta]MOW98750.1 immunoglobulin heavy chain junction region [Macaca mulatta]MOW99175.1 immunoglobulin heavy chain junction region [Macaca mulatta]MOW99274.1 immunoglobulin heavy chain junction region [Macaca mulatta]MOW99497.1 immunoglobulin heavy chain junction region [Macaca mulatta]
CAKGRNDFWSGHYYFDYW